jgi:hypothetical protein
MNNKKARGFCIFIKKIWDLRKNYAYLLLLSEEKVKGFVQKPGSFIDAGKKKEKSVSLHLASLYLIVLLELFEFEFQL